MARDRYFFDKRIVKRNLIKYGTMFVLALPILIVMNIYVLASMSFWAATFVDVAILLAVVGLCTIVFNKIEKYNYRRAEEEERRAKELRKAERRRQKSNNAKATSNKDIDVEIVEPKD